jgi:hypothetical protein
MAQVLLPRALILSPIGILHDALAMAFPIDHHPNIDGLGELALSETLHLLQLSHVHFARF